MGTSPSNTTSSPEPSVRARAPAGLGDDDLVADGGTQVMRREPASEHPSSLAALTAALEAKKLEKNAAPPNGHAARSVQMLQARPPVGRKPPRFQPTLPSRVATAVGPVGLPPAPKPEPNLEDLAFEPPPEKIERTQPFRRGLFGVGRGVEPTLESPVWRPRPSAPAHGSYPPPDRRPTSIAPISVDVARSMPPSWSQPPASWAAPKKSHGPVIAAVVAGCVGLCIVALVALAAIKVAVDRASERPAFAAQPAPYEAPPELAPSAPFALPSVADDTAEDPLPPLALDDEVVVGGLVVPSGAKKARTSTRSVGIGSGALVPPPPTADATTTPRPAPEPAKAEPTATAEPAPPPVAPAPAPPPPAPAPTTGVVRVSPSLMTVMVDGDYRRVSNGRVVVTCGRHRINAGRGTRIVDVPCGGVASVP